MPSSRKRTKGKERKARQASLPGASYFTRALDRDTSCSLRHGAVAFSEDVCQFMLTFREELNRQLLEGINTSETQTKEVGFNAFHSAIVVHPKMWLEANREVINKTFVAQGVSCILKDSESSRLMAEQYSAGILTLEMKSQSDVNSSRAFRDICQGGDRALVAFYRKRTPCCCLEERWRKLKAMPAVGLCDGCKEIFPRCTLKLCCGCLCEQYCSSACQERSWRAGHNSRCAVIAEWIQDQKNLTDIRPPQDVPN